MSPHFTDLGTEAFMTRRRMLDAGSEIGQNGIETFCGSSNLNANSFSFYVGLIGGLS